MHQCNFLLAGTYSVQEETERELPAAGQQEAGKSQKEDQEPEKREVAGVENEESGESKA